MKDIDGKALRRKHYRLLCELGIEIVLYNLKTYPEEIGKMHQPKDSVLGFELYGGLRDNVDFDQLFEYLQMIKIATETNNPAVKDALERLKLVIGVVDE